ncbi:hypothetical protein SO802_024707 [Lithocarpus litseifolius]|uniref:Uncharacterized protein n=1 Tax=Lithocarpus litseifolius TaxID=425828 RepID=A0AAW2C9V0_9ROSI
MELAAFIVQLSYCWRHFLCYMSQDCLFNIRSKLSLVDIENEYRLICINEITAKYFCVAALIPVPRYYPNDGVDVDAHDCENSMVATESNNNGVEPSGVGSSNDALHPRWIQIHQKWSIKNLWKTLVGKLW